MIGSLAQGGPWILIAFMTLITISVWIARKGKGDEALIRFLMSLDLRQIMTIDGMIRFAIGFIILGVALWSLPQ